MFEKLLKTYQKPCASANGMACSATFNIVILQMHKNLARALAISLLSFPTNNGDLVGQTPLSPSIDLPEVNLCFQVMSDKVVQGIYTRFR